MSESELLESIKRLVIQRDELNFRSRGRGRGIQGDKRGGLPQRIVLGPPNNNNAEYHPSRYAPPFKGGDHASHKRPLDRGFENLENEDDTKLSKIDDVPTAKRSRALFGNLLGHLKKAKKTLEEEKTTKQAESHMAQDLRVELKLEEQQKRLNEKRRKEYEQKRKAEEQKYEDIQKLLSQKETELLRLHVEKHYQTMMNFLRTRAQPTVFWLPSMHTPSTRKLQLETQAAIENKIASLKETLSASSSPRNTTTEAGEISRANSPPKLEATQSITA